MRSMRIVTLSLWPAVTRMKSMWMNLPEIGSTWSSLIIACRSSVVPLSLRRKMVFSPASCLRISLTARSSTEIGTGGRSPP